jgi:hypothetical protein
MLTAEQGAPPPAPGLTTTCFQEKLAMAKHAHTTDGRRPTTPDLTNWVTPVAPDPFAYWVAVDEWLELLSPGAVDATAGEIKPLYIAAMPAHYAAMAVLEGRRVTQ